MNVQLGAKERIKVYIEQDSKRILGFSPENAGFLGGSGIRYTSLVLNHASEIETWIAKYRIQQEEDAYKATLVQIQREQRFRKEIASKIRARNAHVNQFNRDLNNTLIRLMDERYDQIMQTKLKPVVHGVNEAYEAKSGALEMSLDSPYFSHGPERVAGGSRGDE